MSKDYAGGLLIGIIMAIVIWVVFLLFRRRKSGTFACGEYDERQMIGRGIAYRNGMFTIAICNIIYALLSLFDIEIMDIYTALMSCMIIGIGVFAVTAIRHDAYLAFNKDVHRWYILGGILAAVNLLPGILAFADGSMIEGGKLSHLFTSFLLGLLWLVIILAQFLHSRQLQKEAEEEG